MKRKIAILLLALILVFSMSSCGIISSVLGPEEKTFEKSGLSITLTDEFVEKDYVSYTAMYESADVMVLTLKEERSLFNSYDKNMTLSKYADLVEKANNLEDEFETKDGVLTTAYEKEINGKDMTYYVFVYEGKDAFWLLNIACESKNVEELEDTIMSYAKSVEVE